MNTEYRASDVVFTADSLKEFGRLISSIEDERDRMVRHHHCLIHHIIAVSRTSHRGRASYITLEVRSQSRRRNWVTIATFANSFWFALPIVVRGTLKKQTVPLATVHTGFPAALRSG